MSGSAIDIQKRKSALRYNLRTVLSEPHPGFLTVTFWGQYRYELMMESWKLLARRLVRKYGVFGARVNEWGQPNFHIHVALSKYIFNDELEDLKADTLIGITDMQAVNDPLGLEGYLYKEFTKQFSDGAPGSRQWDCFGEMPVRTRIKDITAEGPIIDAYREAASLREPGDKQHNIDAKAMGFYLDWLKGGDNDEYDNDERLGLCGDYTQAQLSEMVSSDVPF